MIRRIGVRYGSSKAWINRHVNDPYVQRSVKDGLRSRSAYKLQELQDKHKLIRENDIVVDLGAAPGGWSIIASKIINPAKGGRLISLDLLPIQPIPHAIILQGDFTDTATQQHLRELIQANPVNVVLSDMLCNVSGHASTDHFRSMDLVTTVLDFATQVLSPKGVLLCKYLTGESEKDMLDHCKMLFKTVKVVKPAASRGESAEIYLYAKDLKGKPVAKA